MEKDSGEGPTTRGKKRKNDDLLKTGKYHILKRSTKKKKLEYHILTKSKTKGKEENEERPKKRLCLDRGDHEKRKRKPDLKAKRSSRNVGAVKSRSVGSKESSRNPPEPEPEPGSSSSHIITKSLSTQSIPVIDNKPNIQSSMKDFNDKYSEGHEGGKGRFGTVYAGRRLSDLKRVAVKHIPIEEVTYVRVRYQNCLYKIVSEVIFMALAAGRLRNGGVENSGIIGLLDVYELRKEVLIIMERPKNSMDISQFIELAKGQVQEHEAKKIFKHLVDAALLMHHNGIFHQDINVQNVLVSLEDDSFPIWILDFDSSDIVESQPYEGYRGSLNGTPPEVREQKKINAEPTTVWQLGLLLKDIFEHKHSTLNLTRYIHPTQECTNLINQCLNRDPDQRPRLEELQQHSWLQ